MLKSSLAAFAGMMSIGFAVAAPVQPTVISEAVVYQIHDKSYADARDDLVAAIEERGMVISAVSYIKDMIDRTSTDLGFEGGLYSTGGETVLFCKADLSQNMMRDNVHHIALCPYGISVYTLAEAEDSVFLSYRTPPKLPVYEPIHQLLDDIVQSVAD